MPAKAMANAGRIINGVVKDFIKATAQHRF